MQSLKKPRRGLERRIKSGDSICLREGVKITNLSNFEITLSVKTLELDPIGRPNEPQPKVS